MSLHHDLLAEIELTMVPSLRLHADPGLYVPQVDLPEGASRSGSSRRSFWCSLKEQEVEVEFEKRAFLGFPRLTGVKRCSAFEQPDHVACGRPCLDAKFRRQWPYALPVADPRRKSGA
jgi:hypothetical protein